MKLHGWPPTWQTHNFAVAPAHTAAPSRSQRFHCAFLGGEPRGVTLLAVGLGIAVISLAAGEDTIQESVAEPLHRVANAWDFGNVDTATDDHVSQFRVTPTITYRSLSPRSMSLPAIIRAS